MELEIISKIPWKDIENKTIHVVVSLAGGLMPMGTYVSVKKIEFSEEDIEKIDKTIQEKNETVCLVTHKMTIVPLTNLTEENIKECFDANEGHVKCKAIFFDLERTKNNDLLELIKNAFDKYKFRNTQKVYVLDRSI